MPHILVVDDEPSIVAMLEDALTDEGYSVATAASGAAALAQAAVWWPDVVLCDQMMPTMTGDALCHALRAQDARQSIRIILMSAGADQDTIDSCPYDAFLPKPFPLASMLALVHEIVGQPCPADDAPRAAPA